MPVPLLGLLMLVCSSDCALPLPGGAVELHRGAPRWQWCLRVDGASPWRLCDDEWPAWWRARREGALRDLGLPAAPPHR